MKQDPLNIANHMILPYFQARFRASIKQGTASVGTSQLPHECNAIPDVQWHVSQLPTADEGKANGNLAPQTKPRNWNKWEIPKCSQAIDEWADIVT